MKKIPDCLRAKPIAVWMRVGEAERERFTFVRLVLFVRAYGVKIINGAPAGCAHDASKTDDWRAYWIESHDFPKAWQGKEVRPILSKHGCELDCVTWILATDSDKLVKSMPA